jgi:hypothetical protein
MRQSGELLGGDDVVRARLAARFADVPVGDEGEAAADRDEPVEEPADLLAGAQGDHGGDAVERGEAHPVGVREPVGEHGVRDDHVRAGRQRLVQRVGDRVGLVVVPDEVEHGDEQQRDRLGEVEVLTDLGPGEQGLGVPHVSPEHDGVR